MSDDTQQPIIVKKIKKGGGGAHGGAWKIAYADFVTAMMAFFLLMWLLGSTAQGDLEGIAEYFENPLKVAQQGGSGSGDSSSVIQGGGRDLTRQSGQVKYGTVEAKKRSINLTASKDSENDAKARAEGIERAKLIELKSQIEARVEANPDLRPFRNQLVLDVTSEGLRIQIVDEQNRPMFTSASERLQPYTSVILREIGLILNQVENRIFLSGHTDATPFAGGVGGFSNWELSANRANASRRELIAGGMDPDKVLRVVGMGSIVSFDKEDPYNPINRRISIIVLNRQTEELFLADGKSVEVENLVGGEAEPAEP
ncbi:flagellar motor protein MotB [Methyloversatilis sp.]|uniref:flagellar motor protein MotB n=1 Tax=Methyloversatilis sp. TaxID=2569862 RepID=UPI0027367CC6|nr:flagellar motor protein MotB [Methyloversatilis sp.]MDP2869926.1 flagellar motor protein MotB [Methyloversatilis sp.]MDP3455780.1 flagellar motor protein MotB [Methyloversatilis sp.]MDP3577924.1 flagellar motor protein MotB [Methyloversatilis sp.]